MTYVEIPGPAPADDASAIGVELEAVERAMQLITDSEESSAAIALGALIPAIRQTSERASRLHANLARPAAS